MPEKRYYHPWKHLCRRVEEYMKPERYHQHSQHQVGPHFKTTYLHKSGSIGCQGMGTAVRTPYTESPDSMLVIRLVVNFVAVAGLSLLVRLLTRAPGLGLLLGLLLVQ